MNTVSLSFVFPSRIFHLHVISSTLSWVNQPVSLSLCCLCCRQPPSRAAEVINAGIYLYNWSFQLEGKDRGSSCHGAEGTAVPQCSVPHYCFLMRRSEGLQQVSHLATRCMTVGVVPRIWWCSGFQWGTCVGRWCIVLKTCCDKIKKVLPFTCCSLLSLKCLIGGYLPLLSISEPLL